MTMVCCRKLSEAERVALPECRGNLKRQQKNGCNKCCSCMGNNLQLFLIFAGLIIGCVLGLYLRDVGIFREPGEHPREMMYFTFVSDLINRVLRLVALPLTIGSIISGISTITTRISNKIGLCIGVYYVFTSLLATVEGFLWMYAFKPGVNKQNVKENLLNTTSTTNPTYDLHGLDILLDFLRNMFPDNFVSMTFEKVESSQTWVELQPRMTGLNHTMFVESSMLTRIHKVNLLGIVTSCVILGFFITKLTKKKSKFLSYLFEIIYEVTAKMYIAFLWLYPIGVALFIARAIIEMKDPVNKIVAVGRFLLAVLVGELAHVIIVIPVLFWIFTRKNPFFFFVNVLKAMLMAIASADSMLTLPVTLECLEKNTKINANVARYTCPIGSVFNMDGSTLYNVMLVVFFAKFRGIGPGILDLVIMGAISLAMSFGSTHVRDRAILYAVLFHALGLPTDDLVILIPLEWMLVRLCTMVSVWSDCVGTAIVDKLVRKDLELERYKNSPQYKRLKYGDDYIHNSDDESFV